MSRTRLQPCNTSGRAAVFSRSLTWLGWVALALFVIGCGLIKPRPSPPKATVESLRQSTNRPIGSVSMIVLQAEGARFADNYAAMISQATDDFVKQVATPEARLAALKWKLSQATAAYVDASGPHPILNTLDLVVLATVSRMVIEDYGVGEIFGEAARPMLETHRRLETNAWTLVNGVLRPEQRQELAEMIQKWREENPHQRYVGGIRFGELAAAVGKSMQLTSSKPTSVFSLLFLDPLASMDPTAAALQEARYSAERAMYYGQRMPQLLNWQVELLASQIVGQPEPQEILSNAQRLVSSAEVLAQTSKQLPQQLTNLFVSEEKRVRDLLGEARQTLSTGNEMAASVNTAVKSLDAFVRLVTATNSVSIPDSNRPPFNVLDYGTAAAQVTVTARELNTLLAAMRESTPQLEKLSQQITERADLVLDRAFRLGLGLIVVLFAALVLAGVLYRALVSRFTSKGRKL